MASIGHIAVGLAAGRVYNGVRNAPALSSMAFWSALSLLPDLDVIGLLFGAPYGSPWGHRGATHSLVFTLGLGLAAGGAAPAWRLPRMRTALTAALVLVSHPLLDSLTNGGLGCALFWPFDNTRYFAPWRPIPVAPLLMAYFSVYGMMVAVTETVIFSPLLIFGLWPGRNHKESALQN